MFSPAPPPNALGLAGGLNRPGPLPADFLLGSANRRQQEGISDKEVREIGVLLCLSSVSLQVAVSLTLKACGSSSQEHSSSLLQPQRGNTSLLLFPRVSPPLILPLLPPLSFKH